MIRTIPRLWLVLDIAGSALGLLVTLPVSFAFAAGTLSRWIPDGPLSLGLALLVAVIVWGAAAISRLAPAPALIVAWIGALLQMACGFSPGAYDLAILVVLFATSAWGSLRVLWLGGASALGGGVIAGFYLSLMNEPTLIQDAATGLRVAVVAGLIGAVSVLTLVMAWVAGLLWRLVLHGRRTREAQVRAEAVATAEQERVRIARDMHDVVAHSLAVVIAQSDGARYAAAADPAQAVSALTTIGQTARAALSDVRLLLAQLRHREGEGPQPTLADLEALYAQVRAAGVEPRVTVDPMPPGEPPASIQLAVYRILQEALTNAIRHGDGDVDVRLSWHHDRVDLVVRNTVPPTPRHGSLEQGHGLIGMRERAQLVGGSFAAGHADDAFLVRATLPVVPVTA
ncbi:sensor histidine kinase [Microbacterium sp. 22242]|uniref:sensor histidine kinase n=1 Tax=Microbacterium sp. 22242 TaxID=3453896 RepID=UPI003F85A744